MQSENPSAAPPQEGTFAARVAKGAAWTVGMRVLDRGLGVVSTLVLARLLVPADFGLVAMALAVMGLLETLTQFGFDFSLIRNPKVTRADYDTAWTLYVILGTILAVLVAVSAAPAAHFYRTPEVATILYTLAIVPLVSGFSNIGIVDFRRDLQFHRDFAYSASKRVAGLAVTLPLAYFWRNHWALVVGMMVTGVVGLALSYGMSPYRPRFSLEKAREIIGFSLWLLLHNMLFFLRVRSAAFFLGRWHGAKSVGMFTMANDIASLPSTELVMPLDRTLFPSYSKLAPDMPRLSSGFTRVLALIALIALPASIGLALVADLVVPLLLGPQWLATVPVMQLLALFGATIALQMNCGAVLVAVGKPRLQAVMSGVQVLIMVLLMLALVPDGGAIGAAWSYLVAGLVSLPVSYWITLRPLQMRFQSVLAVLWRPALGAGAMCLALVPGFASFNLPLSGTTELATALALKIGAGATVYVLAVAAAWWLAGRPEGAERDLLRLVTRRL